MAAGGAALALLLVGAAVWAFVGGDAGGGGAAGQRDYRAPEAGFVELSQPLPGVEAPAGAGLSAPQRLMLARADGSDPYAGYGPPHNPNAPRGTVAERWFGAMFEGEEQPGTFWNLPPDPGAEAFAVADDLRIPVSVQRGRPERRDSTRYPVVPADLGGPFVAVMAPTDAPAPDLPEPDAGSAGDPAANPRRRPAKRSRRKAGDEAAEAESAGSSGPGPGAGPGAGSDWVAEPPRPAGAILVYDLRTGRPFGRFAAGAAAAFFRDPRLSPDGRFLLTPPAPAPVDRFGRPEPAAPNDSSGGSDPAPTLLVWPHDGGDAKRLSIPGSILWAGFVGGDSLAVHVQTAAGRALEFWDVTDGERARSVALGSAVQTGAPSLPGGFAPGGGSGFDSPRGPGGRGPGGAAEVADSEMRGRVYGAVSPGGKYVAARGPDELAIVAVADGAVVGRRPRPAPAREVEGHTTLPDLRFSDDGTLLRDTGTVLSATTGAALRRLDLRANRAVGTPFPDAYLLSPFPVAVAMDDSGRAPDERTRAVLHFLSLERSTTFEPWTIPLGTFDPVIRRLGPAGYLCLNVPAADELNPGRSREPVGDEAFDGQFGLYVNRTLDAELAAALREQAPGWSDGFAALDDFPPADRPAVAGAGFEVPPAEPFVEPAAWTPLPPAADEPAPVYPAGPIVGTLVDANATSYVTLVHEPVEGQAPPIGAAFRVFAQRFDSATNAPLGGRFAVASGAGAAPGYLGFMKNPSAGPRGALSADGELFAVQDPYDPRRVKVFGGAGEPVAAFHPRGRTVPADRRDESYDELGRFLGGPDEDRPPSPTLPAISWMRFDAEGNLVVLCDGVLTAFSLPVVEPRYALDLSATGLTGDDLRLGPGRRWLAGRTRRRATFVLLAGGEPAGGFDLPPGRLLRGDAVSPDGGRWIGWFGEYLPEALKSTGIGTSVEGPSLPSSVGAWDLRTGRLAAAVELKAGRFGSGDVVGVGGEHALVLDDAPQLVDLKTGLHVAGYVYKSVVLTRHDDGSPALTEAPEAVVERVADQRHLLARAGEVAKPYDPVDPAAPDQRDLFDPARSGGLLADQALTVKVDAGAEASSRAQAEAIARALQERGYRIGPDGWALRVSYAVKDSASTLDFSGTTVPIPMVSYDWKLVTAAGAVLWEGTSGGYFQGRNSKYFLNPTGRGLGVIPADDVPAAQQYSVENYLFPDGDMRTAVVEEILAAERDYGPILDKLPPAVLVVDGRPLSLPREVEVDAGFEAPPPK